MDKLEKLADRLQASIDFATEQKEDFEASSWNYQEGVLLNHNEAKLVVELVKKLTIPVVGGSTLIENNKKLKKALHQIYTMQDGWVGEHVDKTKKIIQATFKID